MLNTLFIENNLNFPTLNNEFHQSEIENAFYESMLIYSIRHLKVFENISQENILNAIQKALQICQQAGINSKHHFKKIYVFDSTRGNLFVDWRMSKTGFNLLIIQIPTTSKKLASWILKIAEQNDQ